MHAIKDFKKDTNSFRQQLIDQSVVKVALKNE